MKRIKNMKQARKDFAALVTNLGLNVDGGAIFDAVQARGFKREARTFSICLATAALVETGLPVEEAIDSAVRYLDQRLAAMKIPPIDNA